MITDAKKEAVTRRAAEKLREFKQPIKFELDITLAVGLIGQLQLAFRHPGNTGASRQMLERFVREMIERIDPEHGDVHTFLLMGFCEEHDD